jgi:hypothetical protein
VKTKPPAIFSSLAPGAMTAESAARSCFKRCVIKNNQQKNHNCLFLFVILCDLLLLVVYYALLFMHMRDPASEYIHTIRNGAVGGEKALVHVHALIELL